MVIFVLMLSHHSCPCGNSAPTCTTLRCHYPCSLFTMETKCGKDYMSDTKLSDFKQHTTPSHAARIKATRRVHWILEVDILPGILGVSCQTGNLKSKKKTNHNINLSVLFSRRVQSAVQGLPKAECNYEWDTYWTPWDFGNVFDNLILWLLILNSVDEQCQCYFATTRLDTPKNGEERFLVDFTSKRGEKMPSRPL